MCNNIGGNYSEINVENSCLHNKHTEKAFVSSLLDPKPVPHRIQSNSDCKGVKACLLYFYTLFTTEVKATGLTHRVPTPHPPSTRWDGR
jgi:hypothetical protein